MSTTNRILHGDCRDMLRTLADCSVDSIVTDPPYELGFMGKHWDASGIAYNVDMWRECLRVLKPGGHLLAFGGTRTYHRMAVAIEDAGFEIRDSIHWLYGSGFPKSLDVSKAIDKAAGAERQTVRFNARSSTSGTISGSFDPRPWIERSREIGYHEVAGPVPATDAARQWDGWGTALKPAHEPIVVARKPLVGTVAQNVLEHGTGALNIDGGRVSYASDADKEAALAGDAFKRKDTSDAGWSRPWMNDPERVAQMNQAAKERAQSGRWPANLVLTHAADCADTCAADCPVAELDRQSGTLTSGANPTRRGPDNARNTFGGYAGQTDAAPARGIDTGGASRFFTVTEWDPITDVPFRYVAKPGKTERNAGLDALPAKSSGETTGRKDGSAGLNSPRAGAGRTGTSTNIHPTVKPVALMRHLVRLVTPPDGTVLDPFLGSGTTAVAAILEGFDWIGCELTADYLPIIEGRTAWAQQQIGYVIPTRVTSSEPDQLALFS